MTENLPKIYFWPFTLSVILAKKVEFIYLFILTFNLFSESLFFVIFDYIKNTAMMNASTLHRYSPTRYFKGDRSYRHCKW